ncbi:MAG TPA: endo-1,4-beta-xylanase [Kofleriaceae bacterium]|nr:endo-1,4-beta-xylanase [Kofleriaceae bacterium]
MFLSWLAAGCAAPEPDAPSAESVDAIAHRDRDGDHDGDRDHDRREHHRRPIRSLADAAARTHRLIGTAVDAPFLTGDPVYAATLAAEFSYLTPGNETKWGSLQPVDADHWSFGPADEIMGFGRRHGLAAKGHVLVWHSQLPPFITDAITPEDLTRELRRNIRKVMGRYRSDTRAWDVVNEAFNDDGTLRDTVFLRKLGPTYIANAFRWAHEEDRGALLYYNDFNIDTIGAKSNAVYELVRGLIADHVPIDGVGFQMHLEAPTAPSTEEIVANLRRFTDLGLRVNVSELDVRIANLPGDVVTRFAVERQVFQRAVAACVQVAGCETLTTWGFTDLDSWIDATFGPDDPLELDEQYHRKPAYYGIIDGFMSVPVDPPGTPPNLIANGSFEIGSDGWIAPGSRLSVSRRTAHTGEGSARITRRTAAAQGLVFDALSVVAAGASYDASAWVRIRGAASDTVALTAVTRCSGGADTATTLATGTATDTGWIQLAGTLAVPDCAVEAVALTVAGPAPRVELEVDDAALRPRQELGPELIANPGFETDAAGWFGFGGATVSSTAAQAHSGARSGLATGRTQTFQGPGYNILAAGAIPGATYQASAWVRIAGAALSPVSMTLKSTCAGTDSFQRIGITTANDAGWTLLTGTITLPSCAATELTAYFENPPAGVDLYIDDVSLREDQSVPRHNLIANPDFESGTTSPWFGFGSPVVTATTAQAHGGHWSALTTNRTATFMGPGYDIHTVASPGLYSASAWVRLDGAPASQIFMTAKITCTGAADQFVRIGTADATDSAWTHLTGTLTVPSCPLSGLTVYFEGPAAGVNEYIDDVVLQR